MTIIASSSKKLLFLLLLLSFGTSQLYAQEYFEGTFQYDIMLSGKMANMLMENEPAKRMDLHVKEDNFIIQLYEARVPKTFMFIGDSNHTYVIDAADKSAYLRDYHQDTTKVPPKAQKGKDTVNVKGIPCQVYRVKKPDAITYYYVNDDYRVDLSHFSEKDKAKADFLVKGLDGRIPLKKVIKSEGLTTTIEYRKIIPRELGEAQFRIPADWDLKKRFHKM